MLPPKSSRTGNGRSRAFSLVLSADRHGDAVAPLRFGAAALLSIELRVAQASVSYAKARLNAMVGAKIALGEIQRTLGPDQRVSATADILGDPSQTDPTQTAYYTSTLNGPVVHPRWVGVWNSGPVQDPTASVTNALSTETGKVVQRTSSGYLMDSRFTNGNDWQKNRAGKTPGSTTARFVGWLVSGNEALAGTSSYSFNPFTAVATAGSRTNDPLNRAEDVPLVSSGSIGGTLLSPGNSTSGDYFGARAAKVLIPSSSGSGASYAYWVSDEGVKARINLADKFEGVTPDYANMGNGGMSRLQIPQRAGFMLVQNPADKGDQVKWTNYDSVARASRMGWSLSTGFHLDLPLLDPTLNATQVENYYYNDITFDSAGVASDVVNGGLKKDLTAYFNSNNYQGVPDYSSVIGSGVKYSTPLLQDATREVISPKLGLIYNWYKGSSMPANNFSESAAASIPRCRPGFDY